MSKDMSSLWLTCIKPHLRILHAIHVVSVNCRPVGVMFVKPLKIVC